jgi:PAS fold
MKPNAAVGGRSASRPDEGLIAVSGEPLAPLLAGARARGMADAFALMGLAAVFVGESGRALHVNARAQSLFGGALALRKGRLTAADAEADRALGQALDSACAASGEPSVNQVILVRQGASAHLTARILPIEADGDDRFQLLKAVVILEEQRESPSWLDNARLAGLN